MKALRVAFVALFLLVITLALLPFHILAVLVGGRRGGLAPMWWQRAARAVLRMRVVVSGEPTRARPLLLASNHTSWLDIVTLGSVMPLSFIAKSEVAGWPVFGWLAKLQRTVFVERRRGAAGAGAETASRRLVEGDAIVLFAEGTTGDGTRVLPFRSALIGAAEQALGGRGVVQPVALAYTRRRGIALGRRGREAISWRGDADLLPALADVILGGPLEAHVAFLEPLPASLGRKAIAARSGTEVAGAVARITSGRALERVHRQAGSAWRGDASSLKHASGGS